MNPMFAQKNLAEAGARSRWAAQRFARFQRRPEMQRLARRYGEWSQTREGLQTMTEIAIVAMLLAAGKLSRQEYRTAISRIAKTAGIARADARAMTQAITETIQCGLYGSGQVPSVAAQVHDR